MFSLMALIGDPIYTYFQRALGTNLDKRRHKIDDAAALSITFRPSRAVRGCRKKF